MLKPLDISSEAVTFNRYLPFALLYFFFNIIGLPFGLTWTALLGPFFYFWAVKTGKKEILLPFVFVLSPFIILQLLAGVVFLDYIFSLLNLAMIFCFAMAVRTWYRISARPEVVFRRLLIINFLLCLLAVFIYFTPWQSLFWIRQSITEGVRDFPRLKMLTYEASHYATIFVPVFLYFFHQYLFRRNSIPAILLLPMLLLPMLLSFSFGVIASLGLSLLVVLLINAGRLFSKRRILNTVLGSFVILGLLLLVLFFLFPGNILFERIENIFAGSDSSAEGRTGDAFRLAFRILEENGASWFGIGPGQLKYLGDDIIREYYLYYESTAVAIPNVAAETLLLFGWMGLGLRILLLLVLFRVFRVWTDYFRLSLFLFMFIYQFTGSYITNPAEWVIWALVFGFSRNDESVKRPLQGS